MQKQIPYLDLIDQPEWRGLSATPASHVAGASIAGDYRNDVDGDPNLFYTYGPNLLAKYNTFNDGWVILPSPQLPTFTAGADSVFHPSAGPRQFIFGSATTTTIPIGVTLSCTTTTGTMVNGSATLTSASLFGNIQPLMGISGPGIPDGTYVLSKASSSSLTMSQPFVGTGATANYTFGLYSSVAKNQLANRGDDTGFKIRVIDNAGTGKVEERYIVSNTAGINPTITLNSALSFTPAVGSKFEIHSGRLYMMGSMATTQVTTSSGLTAGSAVCTAAGYTTTSGHLVGMGVSGTGVLPGSYIISIQNGVSITLNQPVAVTGAGVALTFPFVATGATASTTTGSTFATIPAITAGLVPGMIIGSLAGNAFPAGTKVLKVLSSTSFIADQPATSTNASHTLYFYGGNWNSYSQAVNEIIPRTGPYLAAIPTISTEGTLVSLSEDHVPTDKNCGDGFFGQITASASGASTITSATSGAGADALANVAVNEYRNFQIRIVQDLVTPGAAGQRGRISSHTAGVANTTSPVYTLYSPWTVQPSSSAKFVIENDDDKIIYFSPNSMIPACYSISTDSWDYTTFTQRGNSVIVTGNATVATSNFIDLPDTTGIMPGMLFVGAGSTAGTVITTVLSPTRIVLASSITTTATPYYCYVPTGTGLCVVHPFGIPRTTYSTIKHSVMSSLRGLSQPYVDQFDIAGSATGVWTTNVPVGNSGTVNQATLTSFVGELFTTGTCSVYAPGTHDGKFAYVVIGSSTSPNRFIKWDLLNNKFIPFVNTRFLVGSALAGNRLEVQTSISPLDNTTKYSTLYHLGASVQTLHSILLK